MSTSADQAVQPSAAIRIHALKRAAHSRSASPVLRGSRLVKPM
jgi:hypothetical protein